MAPFTSRDKKKAKRDPSPGSPEVGELISIVPPSESNKTKKTKSGPKTTIDERDERKRENAIIRHAWFKWFASQANLTPMRKLYWTFGADKGRKRFENKLVELGTEAFAHLSLDPDAPLFSHYTLDVQTRLRKYVTERARVWQEWFKKPQELTNSNSLSFKYKECEPMFDNKIRWINFNTWLTPMVARTRLDAGLYGTVYKVGVLDSSLVADLGSHEMVFYVAKILNDTPWSNARDEMLKELFAFTVNHPTVVRPVAAFSDPKAPGLLFPWWNRTAVKKWYEIERRLRGKVTLDGKTRQVSKDIGKYDRDHQLNATIFRRHRLQIAGTLLQGLAFMHGRDWLHCGIHYGNIFVHFPLWDWDDKQAHNKRHDNLESDGDRIKRKLLFVGIGDLGYAQTTQDAAAGKRRYNQLDKEPRKWTAPELTVEKVYTGDDGTQYLTNWTKSTDVFAMGWLIREICGDFLIDMSREEKLEYDREKWAMGYPTTSEPPHQTLRLKEALDAMVYLNISSLRDHRKTAEYWAHYFIDQLMVDPTICMRPIESKKRAAKHPDGPRDIKENKW
ncbi:hypothetical protein R1sor_008510 [Riccia sorocarpa]|uniref:Protein kinase domain-containing protein n=1 Tax=Riccia sorocarpa TaxID=122646 RepID=A0ABD3HX28_9MARC